MMTLIIFFPISFVALKTSIMYTLYSQIPFILIAFTNKKLRFDKRVTEKMN